MPNLKAPVHDEDALIWLPGLVCDEAVWSGVRAHASAPGLVVAYPDACSIDAMAQRVVDAAAGRRVWLIGHSMGGRVAIEAARRLGLALRGLVLASTGHQPLADGEAGDREREGRAALVALARSEGMRAMGRQWVRGMVRPEHLGTPIEDAIVDMIARHTPATFECHVQALLDRPDATATLAALPVPVLLLCGAQDSWSPPARHLAISRIVQRGQLQIIEGAGHMLPMEQPRIVAHAIQAWMQRAAESAAH
jgi:pimeloyl-ACP methyl ester carboxylesterase